MKSHMLLCEEEEYAGKSTFIRCKHQVRWTSVMFRDKSLISPAWPSSRCGCGGLPCLTQHIAATLKEQERNDFSPPLMKGVLAEALVSLLVLVNSWGIPQVVVVSSSNICAWIMRPHSCVMNNRIF